ncbi:MAG: ParA family protein [Candidatus Woesearchaeota archaeon]
MRKICILNQKGGVAKTTTAINLASGLAIAGKRVLLLDLDPQGHVATYFPTKEYKKTMFEFLTNGADIAECVSNVGKNLDVIRSSKDMRGVEAVLYKNPKGAIVLSDKMRGIKGYDYCIADCPPSVGVLSQNAMLFADELIIPTTSDPLGLDGLRKMLVTVGDFKNHSGHELKVTKIVPTMYDSRNKICRTVLSEMRDEYYEIVSDPVRLNSKIREAPRAMKSIFTYAPKSSGAEDYRRLVDSILVDETVACTPVQRQRVAA